MHPIILDVVLKITSLISVKYQIRIKFTLSVFPFIVSSYIYLFIIYGFVEFGLNYTQLDEWHYIEASKYG